MTFDWTTLAFQTVNVVLLIWLLSRAFWRPVTRLVAERKDAVMRDMAAAETARHEAEGRLAEIAGERQGIGAERKAILAEARAEAAADRATLAAEAGARAEEDLAAARARIASERDAAEAAYAARAVDLAVEMAERIGRGLDGPALRAAALDALAARIADLPETERCALRKATSLAATTATPLEDCERQALAARIAEVLGDGPAPAFRTDPDLVAGIEIATPHLVLAQSWREDLARMRREIDDER